MRSFAQTNKVFDGNEAARHAEDHIDSDETSKLQPGKGGAVDPKPHRLTDNDICFGGSFFIGKSFVKKINNGKDSACERHKDQNKKSPARPDVWKCVVNDVVQTTPANKDEKQGRDTERLEFKLFIHRLNYTRREDINTVYKLSTAKRAKSAKEFLYELRVLSGSEKEQT